MVDKIEFEIIDADSRNEPDTCGDCIFYTGEECNGPSWSREGGEVYDDTNACDCFDPITNT